MHFLKTKVWPTVAGLLVAFIVMLVLEFVNSLVFPLPKDLDWGNTDAVRAFTSTLPWTAYILVLLGWVLGAFKAGCVTTYLSGEQKYRLSLLVGVLLTLGGIVNNSMLGHDMVFNLLGLPMFIIFTYIGHRYLLYAHAKKQTVANVQI